MLAGTRWSSGENDSLVARNDFGCHYLIRPEDRSGSFPHPIPTFRTITEANHENTPFDHDVF